MTEQGVVVGTSKGYATIRVNKKDECSKCGMCVFGKNASYIDLNAKNDLGANVGETVTFTKRESGKLLGAIMVFLIPLILIIASSLIATLIIRKEIWILFLSLISIALWYTILAIIDKKLKTSDRFCAEIISVDSRVEE